MDGVWQRYGQNISGVWVEYCWNMGEKQAEYGLDIKGIWVEYR